MKREEKNLQSKARILKAAMKEFSTQGYGLSSINTICMDGGISKGVLYHYYEDKDTLFLACVQECFDAMTAYLKESATEKGGQSAQAYFDARLAFFKQNPLYQRLFCDAVISPPEQLREQIAGIRQDFDALNTSILTSMLKEERLRDGIDLTQAIETFRLFQDFANARYQMPPDGAFDIAAHEDFCSRSLSILLYGVVRQEDLSK